MVFMGMLSFRKVKTWSKPYPQIINKALKINPLREENTPSNRSKSVDFGFVKT